MRNKRMLLVLAFCEAVCLTLGVTACGSKGTEGLLYTLTEDESAYTVTGYEGTATKVVIPEKHEGLPVVSIAAKAFQDVDALAEISIPSTIESVGNYAFADCDGLTEVYIPHGPTFSSNVFSDCKNLKKIEFAPSVTEIKDNMFSGCTGLVELVLPDQIERIGSYAFGGCNSLISVTLGENVTSIATGAFV